MQGERCMKSNLTFSPGLPMMLALALLGGCSKAVDNQAASNNASQAPAIEVIDDPDTPRADDMNVTVERPTDAWVGRWAGPEGLFLDIQPSSDGRPDHVSITNRDTLDRQAEYSGVSEGATIRFVRDGRDVTIRPGSGAETGFKYLADKSDCLILIPGREGYCR